MTDGYTVLGFNRSKENKSFLLPYQNSKNKKNYKFIQLDINKDVERLIYNLDLFKPNIVVDFLGQGMVAESWLNPYNGTIQI